MKYFLTILAFIFFLCSSCKDKVANEITSEEVTKTQPLTTAESIANKNGYENWNDVSEIQFTFNFDRGGSHFERSWIWWPKLDQVQMKPWGEEAGVLYKRSEMDSLIKKADARFINDSYWLLAPFNLVWDEGTTFSEEKNVTAPISKETMNQLTITYGNEGGYTPGDAYDLFYSDDFMLKEWAFRAGNDSIASMTTTWEDYKTYDGIQIATMHQDSTQALKLYFTDISVK